MKILFFLFTGFLLTVAALALGSGQSAVNVGLAELSVRNLTCGACAGNIEKSLADLPGIDSVAVDLGERRVRVKFDSAQVNAGNIAEAVSAAGYPAALVRSPVGTSSPLKSFQPAQRTGGGCGGACCSKQ